MKIGIIGAMEEEVKILRENSKRTIIMGTRRRFIYFRFIR